MVATGGDDEEDGGVRMNAPRIIPAGRAATCRSTASDPGGSAWVSANAGSGKTHVLAQRVIRLLLDGIDPAKILCLTFTKAAAANMANRVFDTLRAMDRARRRDARRGDPPRSKPQRRTRGGARTRAGCSRWRSRRRAG